MKIVTWNCNGALRNKTDILDSLEADILIIQECEDPSRSTKKYLAWAKDYIWTGETKNKGIGVFSRNGVDLDKLDWNSNFSIKGLHSKGQSLSWNTADLKLFLPFLINKDITMLSVWTKGSDSQAFGYMGQFWKYLQLHREDLSKGSTIIIGDFNSNSRWDKSDRWWSHSDVVDELKDIDMHSLYHYQFNESQGNESVPTFYMHRNKEKPYHIDYCFVSGDILNKSTLEIGNVDKWLSVSDHIPIIVTL